MSESDKRAVYCKAYHIPRRRNDPGGKRRYGKSKCPAWAMNPAVQQTLINEALPDPDGALDAKGRPKTLWNAVSGEVFVGVSCNLDTAVYNCYPEVPPAASSSKRSRGVATERSMISGPTRRTLDVGTAPARLARTG